MIHKFQQQKQTVNGTIYRDYGIIYFWLDAKRNDEFGAHDPVTFTWIGGSPMNYTNWKPRKQTKTVQLNIENQKKKSLDG